MQFLTIYLSPPPHSFFRHYKLLEAAFIGKEGREELVVSVCVERPLAFPALSSCETETKFEDSGTLETAEANVETGEEAGSSTLTEEGKQGAEAEETSSRGEKSTAEGKQEGRAHEQDGDTEAQRDALPDHLERLVEAEVAYRIRKEQEEAAAAAEAAEAEGSGD